jgi:hypothetical protein
VQYVKCNPNPFNEINLESITNCDVCMQRYDGQWAKDGRGEDFPKIKSRASKA